MKTVHIVGHEFDALPGHIQITGRGTGSNLRAASCNALRDMFKDSRLRHKRVGSFKLSAVVVAESNEKAGK